MKLYKQDSSISPLKDKAASTLATGIIKCQSLFASTLYRYTNKWKVRQQWIFLYFVCGSFISLSIFAAIYPFKEKETGQDFIPKAISFPKNISSQPFQITEKEFQKVQQFKNTHPDLLKEHPGLYDSLKMVEQAYYSQKK
jgi:hypothetical protein